MDIGRGFVTTGSETKHFITQDKEVARDCGVKPVLHDPPNSIGAM